MQKAWPLGLILLIAVPFFSHAQVAQAQEFDSGTVVIRDALGDDDLVFFYFDAGNPADAEQRVRETLSAAGLPIRGLSRDADESSDEETVIRVRTTLGTRVSTFDRRIDPELLHHLDLFKDQGIVVEPPAAAHLVSGSIERLDSSPEFQRWGLDDLSAVEYTVPASDAWLPLAIPLLVAFLGFFIARSISVGIEGSVRTAEEKVHTLQRLGLVGQLLGLAVFGVLVGAKGVNAPRLLMGAYLPVTTRIAPLASFLTALSILLAVVIPVVSFTKGWTPSYRRIRAIERPGLKRRIRLLAAAFLPLLLWFVVLYVINSTFSGAVLPVLTGVLAVLFITIAPVIRLRLLPTRPLDGETRSRALQLARRAGVRIADIRVLQSSGIKIANAFVMGPFSRARYIVLTDTLLEKFSADEVDAVVGHELGHAKKHDIPIKAGIFFGTIIIIGIGSAIISGVTNNPAWSIIVAFAIYFAFLILIGGRIGVSLEQRADDFGADLTSVDAMIDALEHLATTNPTKRRSSRFWAILTQHPGIEDRVARLRVRRPIRAPLAEGARRTSPRGCGSRARAPASESARASSSRTASASRKS